MEQGEHWFALPYFYFRKVEGIMNQTRYRVTNKCRYDIGVKLSNNQDIVIKAGSFQMLTSDDIVYIESVCFHTKLFAKRMLVPYDSEGKEVTLAELGMYASEEDAPHLDDVDIGAMLKQSAKKIEAWISGIEDQAELHAIFEVAKTMDLPASKLKILASKMPNKDIFE